MSRGDSVGGLRIYVLHKGIYRRFCWINMERDASLFFNFTSKLTTFTEYGRSVVRSGFFVDHAKIPPKGNLEIQKAKRPHVSFHPPTTTHRFPVAHIKVGKRVVSQWRLDWFPVRRPQALLYAYSGDIAKLDAISKLVASNEVINVPDDIHCLQMEVALHPIVKSGQVVGRADTMTNLIGLSPFYIVSCHIYPMNVVDPAFYVATDEYHRTESA